MFCELTKEGIKGRVYNPDKEKYERGLVSSILPYLQDEITHVEEGLTVHDFLMILNEHKEEINEHFVSYTNGFKLGPYIEDLKNETTGSKLDKLVFKWYSEITKKENDELEPYTEYYDRVDVVGKKKGDEENYGVSFSSMGDLADAEVQLKKDYYICFNNHIHEEFSIDPYWMEIHEKAFKLIDVIGSFLKEITFNGYPDNREERINDINERIDDTSERTSFLSEELTLEMEEEKMQRFIEEEKFEKANKTQKRIDELKKKIYEINGEDYEIKKPFSGKLNNK